MRVGKKQEENRIQGLVGSASLEFVSSCKE